MIYKFQRKYFFFWKMEILVLKWSVGSRVYAVKWPGILDLWWSILEQWWKILDYWRKMDSLRSMVIVIFVNYRITRLAIKLNQGSGRPWHLYYHVLYLIFFFSIHINIKLWIKKWKLRFLLKMCDVKVMARKRTILLMTADFLLSLRFIKNWFKEINLNWYI